MLNYSHYSLFLKIFKFEFTIFATPIMLEFMNIVREIERKKQCDIVKYRTRLALTEARQSESVYRVERPFNLIRARTLGYKAKTGYVLYRATVKKGDPLRSQFNNGNTRGKCVNAGIHQIKSSVNDQTQAEMLVGRTHTNMRVFNSYMIGKDAHNKYYEVIAVDSNHNSIRNDPKINFLCDAVHKRRECRGLTSAGKKSRGLGKGIKYNKTIGGSRRAAARRRDTVSLK